MQELQISLNTIDKVKSFVDSISELHGEFNLIAGRCVIDAKSIMGIFSLDLSNTIDLNIHSEDTDEIMKVLKPYIVE